MSSAKYINNLVYNVNMENQNEHIPEHLQERWNNVNKRLGETSLRMVEANQQYHEAILARIAMSQELKDWQMKTYFDID